MNNNLPVLKIPLGVFKTHKMGSGIVKEQNKALKGENKALKEENDKLKIALIQLAKRIADFEKKVELNYL
jgi:predicted nuclease with TOPRIM domain